MRDGRLAIGGGARAGLLAAVLALASALPAGAAAQQGDGARASGPPRVLDVPYMPQSPALCGGAAAAMVMRYWGESGARPEAFRHLVDEVAAGIRSDELVDELEGRGWETHAFAGRRADLRRHVERGRPPTVLLEVAPDTYHYVVVVAVPEDGVLFHDPARAPYQHLGTREFERRWSAADRWTLLLLPPDGEARGPGPGPEESGPGEDGASPDSVAVDHEASGACAGTVRAAVRRAVEGDEAAADSLLRRAAARCPGAAAPRRELAGLRFRQERWVEASRWAREALSAAPADSQASDLLAASLYMRDEGEAALEAWNRVDRPRVASVRAYGLDRVRWEHVAPRLDVSEGDLLTPGRLALARRRAGSVPAFARSRVRYRPRADGRADVQVAALERPILFGSPLDAAVAAVSALPRRELRLTASGLAGSGETWTAAWRWEGDRPAVRLEAAFPRAFGADGRWEVDGGWERRTFGRAGPAGTAPAEERVRREERWTAGLGFARWATAGLRWETGLGLDRWEGRRTYLRPSAGLELRSADDRVAGRADAAVWTGLGEEDAFARASLEAAWRPAEAGARGWTVELRAGAAAAAREAPLSLWPAAGSGDAGRHLLRAHPALDDGVVTGEGFGRVLAHAGAEARAWLARLGPVRIGAGGFVDVARPWDGAEALAAAAGAGGVVGDPGLLADVGGGLRLAPGTEAGHVRLDVAGGLLDEAGAVSVGWRAPWPGLGR